MYAPRKEACGFEKQMNCEDVKSCSMKAQKVHRKHMYILNAFCNYKTF